MDMIQRYDRVKECKNKLHKWRIILDCDIM